MSAQPIPMAVPHELAQPASDPRRGLRALERPQRRRRPKLVYSLVAFFGIVLIGAAQMGLSLATTQDSFVLADLRAEQRELSLHTQALQSELTGLSSPQYLAANADALGMVVAGSPSQLRLSDRTVLGAGESAGWYSTITPNGHTSVRNAVVAETPLVTAPGATIDGAVAPSGGATSSDATKSSGAAPLPPTITEGLPSPNTH